MSHPSSPREFGQPESPTEEYNDQFYEEQQQHQQVNDIDLGPPASPDGSPDYADEYPDAEPDVNQEGPHSPSPVPSSPGIQEPPESPEQPYSPDQADPQSPKEQSGSPEQEGPQSPDIDDYSDPPQQNVTAEEVDQVSDLDESKSPEKEPHNDDDSNDEQDDDKPAEVAELMTNIFGEDSDDEEDQQQGDDEPRVIGYEDDEEEGYEYRKESDFDRIMEEKKRERSKKRKRRKDGSIDLCSNADGQIKHVVEMMKNAAADDREANNQRRPAIQKTKMLDVVRNILLRADYLEALIDNDMMSAISEWLAPLPDKSLPALEIRTTLLKILSGFPHLEPGTLKQSGLGKAVMLIFKHPKETRENKLMASKLIRDWSQPIFQISSDYSSVSKEERESFDFEHMPEAKRRRLEQRSRESGSSRAQPKVAEKVLGPGDPGYISRARVPKLSTSAYIIRPKPKVDGKFQGATANRQNSRFDRAQRDFKERTRSLKSERAIGVSLEGRRMD